MIYAGIDPDLKNFSFAVIDSSGFSTNGKPSTLPVTSVSLYYVQCKEQLPQLQAVNLALCLNQYPHLRGAIECPIRKNNDRARDVDLFKLARLAGMFEGVYYNSKSDPNFTGRIEVITPNDWKGSTPKLPHQKQVFRKLGWKFKEFKKAAVPELPEGVIRRGYKYNSKTGKYTEDPKLFNLAETWHDLGDSLGIALWVKGSVEKQARKDKWLGKK